MRYRLLQFQDRHTNSVSRADGTYKPIGSVAEANSPEEALASHNPAAGRYLVLCEADHTWRIFNVRTRTERDLEPADLDAAAISSALL